MPIELEAAPMVLGFTVGTVFFIANRLSRAQQPPPPETKADDDIDDQDDDEWIAAQGVDAADLPIAGVQEEDVLETKIANLCFDLDDDAPATTEEPGPEPVPTQEEQSAPRQAPPPPQVRWLRLFDVALLLGLGAFWVHHGLQHSLWATPDPAQTQDLLVPAMLQQPTAEEATPPSSPEVLRADGGALEAQAEERPEAGALTLTLKRDRHPMQVSDGVTYYRSAYSGTLYVGNPKVSFSVVFDTGSGHLILPSAYCKSKVCRARRRYRVRSSRSARGINHDGKPASTKGPRDQITVSFGTGEVSGVFVEDHVCLDMESTPSDGGAQNSGPEGLSPGCLPMRMIAATAMSEDPFQEFKFDGVLGLGLPGLSETPQFNFLNVFAEARRHPANRYSRTFALFLAGGEGDDSGKEKSEITLGGYDGERVNGELAWNKVLDPHLGQWMIPVKALHVDGNPISFCDQGCRAIMDTGTSMISVPSDLFSELFLSLLHVPANGQDCRGPGPMLSFEIEGITLTLEPQDYAHFSLAGTARQGMQREQQQEQSPPVGVNSTTEEGAAREEKPLCKAMLMTMDLDAPIGPKLLILGEPVLRKYYTVYDSEAPPRIGFGRVQKSRWAHQGRRQELGLRS